MPISYENWPQPGRLDHVRQIGVASAERQPSEGAVQRREIAAECERLRQELGGIQAQIDIKRRELLVVDEELLLESFALYRPKFALTRSADYKERLEKIRDYQKALIRDDEAVRIKEKQAARESAAENQLLVKNMAKLLLRSFNSDCEYCVDNVRFSNIEAHEKRIRKSFEMLNRLGRSINVEIAERYKELKIDELHLAYEYECRKQAEKEELREFREQQREQQKLERELREARESIAKDRKHILAADRQYEDKLANNPSPEARADIELKLAQGRARLAELDAMARQVDYREASPKAGFVYVISNIGAFGEGVYKIGVTRRLEADERIDELSDASVPFAFDTHATVFALDAYALETKIHAHFEHCRVNKVNAWKEFFRADIREIEAVIRENYDKTFDLVHEAAAEEFRERA